MSKQKETPQNLEEMVKTAHSGTTNAGYGKYAGTNYGSNENRCFQYR